MGAHVLTRIGYHGYVTSHRLVFCDRALSGLRPRTLGAETAHSRARKCAVSDGRENLFFIILIKTEQYVWLFHTFFVTLQVKIH